MLEKFRNDPGFRDRCVKAAALLIIIAVILLSFDVFTQGRDGRMKTAVRKPSCAAYSRI